MTSEPLAGAGAATTGTPSAPTAPPDPFDLDGFVALPRVAGLALSPDGTRLVVGAATLDEKKKRWSGALWDVDPHGVRPARLLTRSTEGESAPAFTRSGDVLFLSSRPTSPGGDDDEKRPAALWLLPAAGGEPRPLVRRPGGVSAVVVAREAGTLVLGSPTMPSATDLDSDEVATKARKDAGVSAILHDAYPVRFWDHDIGPASTRLLSASVPEGEVPAQPADLTGHVGAALLEADWDVTPDGATVLTSWLVPEARGSQRSTLVALDVATGERTALLEDSEHEYSGVRVSPDGSRVAVIRTRRSTPHDPGDTQLVVLPVGGGTPQRVAAGWDRWPGAVRWTPDSASLVVCADDTGRAPVFRVDLGDDPAAAEPVRLTPDDGAYEDIEVSPDGTWVYAVRSSVDTLPAPVRVPLDPAAGAVQPLPGPAEALGWTVEVPGRLTEVASTAEDGTPLRAWLALPAAASAADPAPLLVWIHGGPLGSWNAWSWRWNPWVAVRRGYAVLLPDPALSTGYGLDFVRRGWGRWGEAPYTDLLALTDAAEARDDVDPTRTAAMGGSFGGYMANWVAGHTDRFDAIVTHASLWALDQFGPTTDAAYYWGREMTEEMAVASSPHRAADRITTPVLVIHGDKDYRVPIGEGLRLWWDLVSRSTADDGSTPHRFLYFPDENHWVLTPGHTKVWYATVLAFADQHVLGRDWVAPDLLQ